MNRTEILNEIQSHRESIKSFGVMKLGLFGSYAQGNASESSDIDFIVEFDKKSFDSYMNLKLFLEDLFHRRVDLVLPNTIKPRLQKNILSQTIYVQGI